MQQPVWNGEIWTALGHVNGAGNVCELWPVARKMFTQNFATLKLKWVGSQICCLHRSFHIPLAQPCLSHASGNSPWRPVVLVAVTPTHYVSMVGYVPAPSWMRILIYPKNTCSAATVTHGTISGSFCGRNVLKRFWNTFFTLAVDWPVCGYCCIHTLATNCSVSVE